MKVIKNAELVIIAGSTSDDPKIKESKIEDILDQCDVLYSLYHASAHRNDDELGPNCERFIKEGVLAFIAIASLNAALPGAIAGKIKNQRPVIGVPLIAKDGFMSGLDAVLAVLRNPPGTAVICPGVDVIGLTNAAHVAIQIVALCRERVKRKYEQYLINNAKKTDFN